MRKRDTNKNDKIIAKILSLVTLCVCMHYFFSLKFLISYLESFNLNVVSILSFEDIQFVMATFNIPLFQSLAILMIGIPLMNMIINISITNRTQIDKRKIWKRIKSISITVTIITFLFIFTLPTSPWVYVFFSGSFSIVIYYFFKDKLLSIIGFIFLIFAFYYYEFQNIANRNPLFNNYVKFELSNGKTVVSDNKDHRLIFFGAKYVILQNGENGVNLYPTSDIREVEWSKLVYSIE